MRDIIGRARGRSVTDSARVALERDVLNSVREDLEAPPPLLLLPLRLEYRVIEGETPLRVTGPVREMFREDASVVIERPARSSAVAPEWRLDAAAVTLRRRREIWFRWFADDDFALRGVAPPTEGEMAALSRFDSGVAGK